MTPSLFASLAAALAAEPRVQLGVVFGSVARGTERADSDVDLAVLGRGFDALTLAAELGRALQREVDVVHLDDAGYPLLKNVVEQGVVVHEAFRGAGAAWRARAIASLETDRPWFERMRNAYLARLTAGQ